MFIHIGNNNAIRSREIVTIIDYNVIKSSSIMEEMLERAQKNNTIIGPVTDAKSVIITVNKIYYSSLSVATLKKRSTISSMVNKFDNYSENALES